MQPHFLSCLHGNGVSQQNQNDLTQFYLHPIIRRMDEEKSAELVAYREGFVVELNNKLHLAVLTLYDDKVVK